MLFLNQLAYTIQPLPDIQPVDLDAIFFDREKLAAESVEFSKWACNIRHLHVVTVFSTF